MVTQAAKAAGAKAGADYAATTGPTLVTAMATAATELSVLVKTKIIANGANFVVVNNLPDIGTTPFAKTLDANTLALVNAMVKGFNDTLGAALASETKVVCRRRVRRQP